MKLCFFFDSLDTSKMYWAEAEAKKREFFQVSYQNWKNKAEHFGLTQVLHLVEIFISL